MHIHIDLEIPLDCTTGLPGHSLNAALRALLEPESLIVQRLTRIEVKIDQIIGREIAMAQELDDLTAKVAEAVTVEQSAEVLLSGLKQKLDDAIASGNPAALTALSTSLGDETGKLQAAILQNTPAATGGGGGQP